MLAIAASTFSIMRASLSRRLRNRKMRLPSGPPFIRRIPPRDVLVLKPPYLQFQKLLSKLFGAGFGNWSNDVQTTHPGGDAHFGGY